MTCRVTPLAHCPKACLHLLMRVGACLVMQFASTLLLPCLWCSEAGVYQPDNHPLAHLPLSSFPIMSKGSVLSCASPGALVLWLSTMLNLCRLWKELQGCRWPSNAWFCRRTCAFASWRRWRHLPTAWREMCDFWEPALTMMTLNSFTPATFYLMHKAK